MGLVYLPSAVLRRPLPGLVLQELWQARVRLAGFPARQSCGTAVRGGPACGCTEFLPESAVLDTWATSSVTPLLHKSRGLPEYPLSMRTHAHEIIRTWTFYSIVRSLYHTGKLPWKHLMISGFVLAKRGEKISKSKGNGFGTHLPDPGAFGGRPAAVGSQCPSGYGHSFFLPRTFSPKSVFSPSFGTRPGLPFPYWKTFPLFRRALLCFPLTGGFLPEPTKLCAPLPSQLSNYEAGQARHEIDRFFWNDFCDTYIELAKERLYSAERQGTDAGGRPSTPCTTPFFTVLKLYAPFAPHITETIYLEFFRKFEPEPSLHLTRWPQTGEPEEQLLLFGERLKENLSTMRREKTEKGFPSVRRDGLLP